MRSALLVLAAGALAAPASLPAQEIAIHAGLIHTLAGPPIQDGVILIRNGVIEAIGPAKEIQIPMACPVVEAPGGVAMPALIHPHTSQGMDRPNESMPLTPFVAAADSLDPGSKAIEEYRRVGYGTVHIIMADDCLLGGVGLVIRPHGVSIQAMTVADPRFQKITLSKRGMSRIRSIQTLHKALADMARELAEKDAAAREEREEAQAKGKQPEQKPAEKLPPEKRDLAALVQGKAKAFFACAGPDDLREALALSKRYGFPLVPVLDNTCHKAAQLLAGTGLAVVLAPQMEFTETDPETGKQQEICPAAVYHKAGIPFAITSILGASLPERYPLWQAAIAVRNGVPVETALAALTTVPARLLGLEKRLGTLEKGKDGSVLLLTGDPLAASTWVDRLFIEGRQVYNRAEDPQLREIFPPKEEEKK